DRIRQQCFKTFSGDFRGVQIEAIRFSGLEIESQAVKLIHDRAAESGRRAQQIDEQAVHHRKPADQCEGERIVLNEGPKCGKPIDERLWRPLLQKRIAMEMKMARKTIDIAPRINPLRLRPEKSI